MSIDWKCAKKFKFSKSIPKNEKNLKISKKRKGKQELENTSISTFQLDKTDIDMG